MNGAIVSNTDHESLKVGASFYSLPVGDLNDEDYEEEPQIITGPLGLLHCSPTKSSPHLTAKRTKSALSFASSTESSIVQSKRADLSLDDLSATFVHIDEDDDSSSDDEERMTGIPVQAPLESDRLSENCSQGLASTPSFVKSMNEVTFCEDFLYLNFIFSFKKIKICLPHA